jgi:hypothetical protein
VVFCYRGKIPLGKYCSKRAIARRNINAQEVNTLKEYCFREKLSLGE